MADAKKQDIKQALNKIDISGVVKEHNLGTGTSESGKYINGSFVVKAGEHTEITVRVFVSELTSKGKVKKSYENLQAILKGVYKTMAEVPEEEAVKVRLWGNDGFTPQFKEEIFKPDNAANVVTKISVDLGFGNLTIDNAMTPKDYKANFDVEVFVESVEDELNKGSEETGRVIIKGWCPVYGGSVIPLDIVAGTLTDEDGEEYDFADDVRSNVMPEDTINIWGDINFKTIVERTSKGGSLGLAKVEEKRTYVHDLVAVGIDFVEDDDAYDVEIIQLARVNRENKKQEAENKAEDGNGKSKKGTGFRQSKRNAARKTSLSEIDDDEIPF